MSSDPVVYLVGIPGKGNHPGAGRFPAFSRYIPVEFVGSPLNFRFMWGPIGSRVDRIVSFVFRKKHYALGLLVMELAAGLHMLRHRGAVYHSLKGEVDLHLLPLFSWLTGTHLVATFHDPPRELREKKNVGHWVSRHLAGVVLLSESQRSHFEPLLPSSRIFLVPHGVDTDLFFPADRLANDAQVIAVGAYGRDFPTLARAIPLVWERNPKVRFTLVGTRQADPWNPAPRIEDPRLRYLDRITDEELRTAYQQSALAVVSVVDATANNALLEAMACGVPVVGTDIGGIPEYLGKDAGLLCEPGSEESLADGILSVLGDRARAEAMGRAGRSRAENYHYRIVGQQLCEVYRKVSGRRVDQPAAVLERV
jgi:glycosyltransferase involved in cell wall biosynthesis